MCKFKFENALQILLADREMRSNQGYLEREHIAQSAPQITECCQWLACE
jgi:hypothetical protein